LILTLRRVNPGQSSRRLRYELSKKWPSSKPKHVSSGWLLEWR
jgi:hypothetical protein